MNWRRLDTAEWREEYGSDRMDAWVAGYESEHGDLLYVEDPTAADDADVDDDRLRVMYQRRFWDDPVEKERLETADAVDDALTHYLSWIDEDGVFPTRPQA